MMIPERVFYSPESSSFHTFISSLSWASMLMYCSFSWCFCFMMARWLWYRAMYSPGRNRRNVRLKRQLKRYSEM